MNTPDLYQHAGAIQAALRASGAIEYMAASNSPITNLWGGTTAVSWPGKRNDQHNIVYCNTVSTDFGKTVGWQVLQGRDFSRAFGADSSAVILNEAALGLMRLTHPLGETVTWGGTPYHIIGIAQDMIRESPFKPVSPTAYFLGKNVGYMELRLSPQLRTDEALAKCAAVFRQYNPGSPFIYHFVDTDFAKKFMDEQRIGKLAGFFAALAIFISCLGLYGLVSFAAEQRTREIGVRKVLGASVFQMWLFGASGAGALAITLITVSLEAIKAAIANPIKSLRTE